MNVVAGLVSVAIGILVTILTRRWFFGSDENFWKSFGNDFDSGFVLGRPKRYMKYLHDNGGQSTVVAWLTTGTLSTLLSYAMLSLLFY